MTKIRERCTLLADFEQSTPNERNTTITHPIVIPFKQPEAIDPLQAILKEGARKLLASAVEAEPEQFLAEQHSGKAGKATVVRNGHLPGRTIQTGLGDIPVKIPKTRDRSRSGIHFNSTLIPPYLKRTQSIEEFLPWLYLRGISTGAYSEALKHLLGPDAPG